jgi:membrane protein required for colicin V production
MNLLAAWLDISLAVVVLLSLIVGVMRGLVFEMLSAIGWFAAYFAAQWIAPHLVGYLPKAVSNAGLRQGLAFAATFVVVLLLWSVVSRTLRMWVRASPMSATDRMLGAGFGLARGLALLLVVATLIRLTPLAESTTWRQSTGAAWLDAALRGLKPVLPSEISRHLPA